MGIVHTTLVMIEAKYEVHYFSFLVLRSYTIVAIYFMVGTFKFMKSLEGCLGESGKVL